MNEHAKYLFEKSFDEDEDGPSPEVEAAFARGHEAGIEAARAESAQSLAQSAGQIVEHLSSLEAVRNELGTRMSQQAVQVAADLVKKMMPTFVARGGMAEIEAVLSDALGRMLEEPRVVFRVPDVILDELQPRLAELSAKAGYSGDVVLIADDQMGASDCLVEWADGGAERNLDRLWSEIEEILQRAMEAATHPSGSNGAAVTQAAVQDHNGNGGNGHSGLNSEKQANGATYEPTEEPPHEAPSQPAAMPDGGTVAEPIQE